MSLPEDRDLAGLLAWEPQHGVLSLYLTIDHGNRGDSWWIAIDGELDAVEKAAEDAGHELRMAVRDACKRVRERLGRHQRPPDGRGVVGFVEIGEDGGGDLWFNSAAAPREPALARMAPRPHLHPLLALLEDNRPRGVVALSGDRARLLEWSGGEINELADREIVMAGDWREQKAPRNVNVPGGQSVTSSGRDQHEQRVEHHRHRFAKEITSELRETAAEREWDEVICFGEPKHLADLEGELGNGTIVHTEDTNVVPEPTHQVADRLEGIKGDLNRKRELALIDRAEEAAFAGGRGSLGLIETAQSLAEGRVEHLLIAPSQTPEAPTEQLIEALAREGQPSALPTAELLIERALQTSARVTIVEDEAAERLAGSEGAAAILRY